VSSRLRAQLRATPIVAPLPLSHVLHPRLPNSTVSDEPSVATVSTSRPQLPCLLLLPLQRKGAPEFFIERATRPEPRWSPRAPSTPLERDPYVLDARLKTLAGDICCGARTLPPPWGDRSHSPNRAADSKPTGRTRHTGCGGSSKRCRPCSVSASERAASLVHRPVLTRQDDHLRRVQGGGVRVLSHHSLARSTHVRRALGLRFDTVTARRER
jgi:hypothetical protein